jgi:hypothetical protein
VRFSPLFLSGCVLAFFGLCLAYFMMSKEQSSKSQIVSIIQSQNLNLTSENVKLDSSKSEISEAKIINQVPDQIQIKQKTVDVPEGALPMEIMISNWMIERQRAAKEAAELNPFGLASGAK